jgi:hypothetical protein
MSEPNSFNQDIYDKACQVANQIGREEEAAELYRSVGCEEEAEIVEGQADRYEAG